MKKLMLFFVLFASMTLCAFAQTKTSADVQKLDGKSLFVLAEPQKEYDVVFKKEIRLVWTNGDINSVDEIVVKLLKMCQRHAEKEKLDFDAIIVNGVQAAAIKFK